MGSIDSRWWLCLWFYKEYFKDVVFLDKNASNVRSSNICVIVSQCEFEKFNINLIYDTFLSYITPRTNLDHLVFSEGISSPQKRLYIFYLSWVYLRPQSLSILMRSLQSDWLPTLYFPQVILVQSPSLNLTPIILYTGLVDSRNTRVIYKH